MKIATVVLQIVTALAITGAAYGQPQSGTAAISMPGPAIGVAWGFSYGYDSKAAIYLPPLKKIGVNLTKLYLFWQQLEPEKGRYQWHAVDTFLQQLTPPATALVAVWSSSTWATKVASQTLPPSPAISMDAYYQFIFHLVKHCKGKIKWWQNDCEPNNPVYWNGTAEEYVNQLKVFYRAVKDADPRAQVVMGGYDGLFNPPGMREIPGQQYGLSFFKKAIKDAFAYFDIFDLRLYADPYTIPARVEYFRQQLTNSGTTKPIICTEYNGPGFFGFPVNFKYIGQVTEWQRVIAARDTAAYLKMKNPIAAMYDSMASLAPQTQMFMMGASKQLASKYHRLQCRDIVMRNIFAFAAGVQKTMYWDFWHSTADTNNLMTVMFGKNKLFEYDNGKLITAYPEAATFSLLTGYLADMQSIKKLEVAGKPLLYLYEVTRKNKQPCYVAWEKRDAFSGEDMPATPYLLPWHGSKAKATDVFGNNVISTVSAGQLAIDISVTPVFIESHN